MGRWIPTSRPCLGTPRARALGPHLATLLVLVLALGVGVAPVASAAQDEAGPRLLYLPMRWCVLEGSQAASSDPDAAVLERIRRASSILAPRAGITLRSAINRSLGDSLGFPVIKDPRRRPGRSGDVRTPVESSAEFNLVVQRCAQAWQRMERVAGKSVDFGGLAKGPIGVIIRDFVNSKGAVVSSVWGYAQSASSNPDYCRASTATVRYASGGSLLVVDSADGHPSPLLDRRLLAHEIGHILRLGHGDGLDNPGSAIDRIDKFCDASENPDVEPGSLMSYNLRYENMESWQQRLTRNVVSRHPAGVQSVPFLQPRVEQVRRKQLQRIANSGRRVVRRLVPATRPPLSPLPRLWTAGVRGDEFADKAFELAAAGDDAAPGRADLRFAGVGLDASTGELELSLAPPSGLLVDGEQEGDTAIDADGDPTTGGSPGSIPGRPMPEWSALGGIELVGRARLRDGVAVGEAWRWSADTESWDLLLPAPVVELAGHRNEEEHVPDQGQHVPGQEAPPSAPDRMVLSLPKDIVELSNDFRLAALLRTRPSGGPEFVDTIPAKTNSGDMVAMSLRDVDYPVCAVNRDTQRPGVAQPGDVVTLEADGFGQDGPVSIWLADGEKPIARTHYREMPCDWPWVGEFSLPQDLGLSPDAAKVGSDPDGLYMLQVVFEDTGLTADCPVVIGDPQLAEWTSEPAPEPDSVGVAGG